MFLIKFLLGGLYEIFRIIADLFQVGRTLFDFGRFFNNKGRRHSGSRNPNDTEFNSSSFGRAHRESRE